MKPMTVYEVVRMYAKLVEKHEELTKELEKIKLLREKGEITDEQAKEAQRKVLDKLLEME